MVTKTWWAGCATAAFILLGSLPARADNFAEQSKKLVEERAYVAFFGSSSGIRSDGDFSGAVSITPSGTGDIELIPNIQRSLGGGALVGYRLDDYAVEVSYWHSLHIAKWTDSVTTFESKAAYQSVNIDLKRYIMPRSKLQPYLSGGFSVPWLVVREASTVFPVVPTVAPTDAVISGFGFNLGVGAEYYLNTRFSIFAGAVQRWAGFGKIKGYSRSTVDIQNALGDSYNLKGDGMNVLAGLTISFL